MTELSFLLELFLNHKLPKPTKEFILARIKEIEPKQSNIALPSPGVLPYKTAVVPAQVEQPQVTQIAHTPEAAAAMAARDAAIRGGMDKNIYKAKPKPAPGG